MPTYSITAPNGRTYRMSGPAGLSQDDLIEHILKNDPEAGKMPPPPKTGMGAAFQSGLENMVSSGAAGLKGIFGDTQAAAEEAAAAEKEQAKKYDPQLGLARLQDVYEKSGILGAGKELVGQGFRGIAQSAPEMATMAGGAKLGSMVGSRFGPVGGLVGGIGGGILGGILPNTGRNLAQQEEAAPGTARIAPALAAGAGQAALEEVTPFLLMGSRVASKVLGVDAAALIKRLGPEAAEEVAKRSLMRTVGRGAAEGAVGEASTEVIQDMLSRLQAGQNLLDADALKTYADSALGGALPGTIMGGAGHAYARSGAKAEVADREQAAATAEEQRAAAEAQAQQTAVAEERARKMADQGYVQQVADDYAAYEKTKAAMHAEAAELKAENTDAGKLAFTDKLKEIAVFERENKDLLKEFNTVARPAIKEAKLRAAAEAAANAKRYGPAVGTPATAKAPQATMFGQEQGISDARKAARAEELQALIDEHEAGIDKAHAQARAAVGTRKSSAIEAVDAELKARDKTYQAAKAELEGLLTPEQRKDRADVEALAAREKALQTFNPVGARKKIDALEKRIAEVEAQGDPSELRATAGWAREVERLQSLLQEHAKRQATPAPAEDLFGLDTRLQGEEQAAQRAARTQDVLGRRGERQSEAFGRELAAEDAGLFSDLPQRNREHIDLLTNRLFATRERSGALDALAGMETEGGPDVASQITGRLESMPDDRRAEVARDLQDYGKTVKQMLHRGLAQARKAGSQSRADSFIEAIRGVTALEEQTKGRAHYTPEFYRLVEPLVPGVIEGARMRVGLGPSTSGVREQALLKGLDQRLAGTIDPRVTEAMQEVADSGETIGEAPQPGRQVPPGTMPRRERLVDEEGQGMLFQPAAGPEVAPAAALRQRIASVLARPDLTRQAKGTLQQADAALDRPDVPQRVLENIEEMVSRAERGVGGGAAKPVTVTPEGGKRATTALEGAALRVRDANAPIPPRKLEGTLRAGPAPKEAPSRAVAGSEAYVPDVAEGKRHPKGFVGPKPESKGRFVQPAAAEARTGKVPDRERVAPQRLETEQAPDTGPEHIDLKQKDLFGEPLFVGRETPAGFQRALDTGALMPKAPVVKNATDRVKNLQAEGRVLAWNLKTLKDRFSGALAARGRLAKMAPMLREGNPTQTREFAGLVRKNLLGVTDEALRAQEAASRHTAEGDKARDAAEAAGASSEEAEGAAYPHRLKAKQEQMTAGRLFAKVDEFNKELKAIDDRDAAPALEALAEQRQQLRKAIEDAQTAIEKHAKKVFDARRAAGVEAKVAREAKAAAVTKSVSGAVGTMGEAKFPTVKSAKVQAARAAAERRAAEREERKAHAEAQRKAIVEAPVGAERIKAQVRPEGIDLTSAGVEDAVKDALDVPGITKTELEAIVDQVSKLHKQNAFPSRQGELDAEMSRIAAEMKALRNLHPAGLLPKRLNSAYVAAKEALDRRNAAVKETESADDRAKRLRWMAGTEARIKFLDSKRVPLNKTPEMHDLKRRYALAEFESAALDMQEAVVRAADYKPVSRERQYVPPKREFVAGRVEPAAELSGDALTRMELAKARKAEKTLYSSKNPGPTPAMEKATAAHKAAARAADAAIAMRKAVDLARAQRGADAATDVEVASWEDEGGRVQKLTADMFDPGTNTPLSEQNMVHLYDGQLDKVLESLAKTGSTPLVRELAAKLQVMAKDTKFVLGTPNDAVAIADYESKTNTITIHPLGLTEETLLHEVGHAATLRSLIMPATQMTQAQINARAGLQALLKQLQADPAFNREYGRTNLAELVSEVLSNQNLRDKIDARKPGFIRRFINAVLQMLGVKVQTGSEKALAQVERLFQPARSLDKAEQAVLQDMLGATRAPSVARAAAPQSAMDRFGSQINAAPHKQGIMSTVKDANAGLYAEMLAVDQRAPIIKALSMGAKHAFMQAQYYIRKSDARMAQVHAVLMNGGPKLKKDAKGFFTVESGHGPSAKDVFAKVDKLPGATTAEKFAKAQSYMVAQRAANVGWDKLGWVTTDQTRKLGEAMLAEVNANPQLKAQLDAVRTSYNEYNKGLVSFLADTGAIPQAEATRLLQHGDYVPFYRVAANGLAELVLGESTHVRIGDIRKQPYLAQLKGDEGKLLPLNEAIMRNTMLLMDKGLTNLATKEIAYGLQALGKERGPVSPRTGERNDLNVIKRGNAPAGADVIKFNQEPDKEGDDGNRWVRITSEGTPYEGIPAEMLVQSLEGTHTVMTGLGKLASKFGDTLRHGVTRSPAYVIRQLIRDPMAASFTGGAERGPVAAMLKSVKEFVDQSKGSTKTGEALLKKGVTQSQVFTGDADDIAMTVHQLAAGNQSAYRKFLNVLDRAAMRADAATRSQVYEDVLKKTGSEMQAELAAIEMMNFTKRGSHPAAQHAARTIPFLNAQIQSLNVLYKAATGKATMEEQMQIRAKFIKSAVNLSLFSMVYAIGMEDNDEYKNATANDRISNFFVPTPWGTFKIPIPYEIGLLFKAIPEVMMHGFDDAEVKALGKMAFNTIPGASSYGIPQMAKPALELAMNKNIYTGRDIETAEQQKLAPELRYNEHTTELAKWAGAQLGASPLKMEHLARGYLGGLPIAAASLANALFTDKTTPSGRASQAPVLGGFVADPLAAGAVERAYEQANAIEQAGNTYDKLKKEGRVKDAERYKEDNLNVLQAEQLNNAFRAAMTRAKQEREKVMASSLSADAKRERLDYVMKWRNDQAALFTKAANSIVAVR